jgi:SAM-dependent methyltransferase
MGKLTEKEHWDSIYRREGLEKGDSAFRAKLKLLATRVFGRYIQNYSDYFLWEVLLDKYMPKTKGLKVLEIGSAPGTTLVRFHHAFGFIPYGVEYSDEGANLNRELFAANNVDSNNVIKADFFSDSFQNKYKNWFDIVLSVGFIEHFTDIEDVVAKHLNLLKRGGCLVVIIPNLRGVNGMLANLFNKKVMAMHNTSIMKKKEFSALFNEEYLSSVYCGYYGIFNFGLFYTKERSPLRFLLAFLKMVQLFLNISFHLIFGNRGADHRLFSPYLIYIGARKSTH